MFIKFFLNTFLFLSIIVELQGSDIRNSDECKNLITGPQGSIKVTRKNDSQSLPPHSSKRLLNEDISKPLSLKTHPQALETDIMEKGKEKAEQKSISSLRKSVKSITLIDSLFNNLIKIVNSSWSSQISTKKCEQILHIALTHLKMTPDARLDKKFANSFYELNYNPFIPKDYLLCFYAYQLILFNENRANKLTLQEAINLAENIEDNSKQEIHKIAKQKKSEFYKLLDNIETESEIKSEEFEGSESEEFEDEE